MLPAMSAWGLPDGKFRLELLSQLIRINDERVENYLKRQITDPQHQDKGALPNRYGLITPQSATAFISTTVSSYIEKDSAFYLASPLFPRMVDAAHHLLSLQHEDGTIDYYATNFHSTPDLAFVVGRLAISCKVLLRQASPDLEPLVSPLKQFLRQAGNALLVGGIHTPNHRWVVSMALARIHELLPDLRYVERIETWLTEKIDIDADGQYTERSTHVYSPFTDRWLITLSRLLNKPALLEPVRQNLDMTMHLIHPNGELVTEISRRQDQYSRGTLQNYYYPYRYMAMHDKNRQYAALASQIPTWVPASSLLWTLTHFQEEPELSGELPVPTKLPLSYRKHFPHAQLIRIREQELDASILGNNSVFFTLHKGKAVLEGVRMASAFFGKGQFRSDTLEEKEGTIILTQELEAPYYQPFPAEELPRDGNWENMPREKRSQSEIQSLISKITIQQKETGFRLQIAVTGTDHVPLAIELGFRKGGTLEGVKPLPEIEDAYLAEAAGGMYTYEGEQVRFGPGHSAHTWTQLRGALPKLSAQSVYITGLTPFHFELTIG